MRKWPECMIQTTKILIRDPVASNLELLPPSFKSFGNTWDVADDLWGTKLGQSICSMYGETCLSR